MLEILDPRPLLDQAAAVSASYGGIGWLVSETIVAGLVHGRQLWFGNERNVGRRLREIADDLGVAVHVAVCNVISCRHVICRLTTGDHAEHRIEIRDKPRLQRAALRLGESPPGPRLVREISVTQWY